MIKISRKLQANPARTTNVPDTSGIKVWVTSMGKEPQLAEVLAEGKGNPELGAEEGSYDHVTRYRNGTVIVMSIPPYFALNVCVCMCFLSKYFCFLFSLIPLSCSIRCLNFLL